MSFAISSKKGFVVAFEQTLKALEQKTTQSINMFFLKYLRSGGVGLDFCDIWFDTQGIYLLLNDHTLIKVFIHKAMLSDRDFQTQGAPLLHIAPCTHVKDLINTTEKNQFVASLASTNAFTYKITGRRTVLRMYQNAPLEICPSCLELLGSTQEYIESHLESLCSSLYAPQDISEEDYHSLVAFFKKLFGSHCACCKQDVDGDSLLLTQNANGAFFLICNQHQGE